MAPARTRRLLSRSFSTARWSEYRRLMKAALSAGYEIVPVERFLDGTVALDRGPILILRHDVDQHPASALEMSGIEAEFGIASTWYIRWRTAHPAVIEQLRKRGAEVGLHYETLTRDALERPPTGSEEVSARIPAARKRLREEIAAFERLFGLIRSVAPHGDTRVPGVSNAALLHREDASRYGIAYDANDAMRGHTLAIWLTDRSAAEGGWADGVDPFALLRARMTPILCLTHPHNWVSGGALWRDRLLSRGLGAPGAGTRTRRIRTGSDTPPGASDIFR
jgi:hypothetical protein